MKKFILIIFTILISFNFIGCSSQPENEISSKWKNAVIKTTVKIISPVAVKFFSCTDPVGLEKYLINKIIPMENTNKVITKSFIVSNLCKLVVNKGIDMLQDKSIKLKFMKAGKCSGNYAADLSKSILYQGCDIIPL